MIPLIIIKSVGYAYFMRQRPLHKHTAQARIKCPDQLCLITTKLPFVLPSGLNVSLVNHIKPNWSKFDYLWEETQTVLIFHFPANIPSFVVYKNSKHVVLSPIYSPPCWWSLEYTSVSPAAKRERSCVCHLTVKLQVWTSGKYEVRLHCHYSQVHPDSKWLYLLG